MRVLDLFAGIGGFSLAGERVGFSTTAFCEMDPFCRKVLLNQWPEVPRLDDIRAVDPLEVGRVDILTGGWPCQGNSVAGKRRGHSDDRSGLFSEILRLIDGMDPRPRFLVLENVPGLVSVSGGRDFAGCINELRRRGYVGCVRRLDAQYDGLAQRRARLFFVCGLGAEGLRAVQLVLEGGRRYPAPCREAGESVAALTANGVGTCGADDNQAQAGHLIAHTLRGEGFDASKDGTGRGTPLVASYRTSSNCGAWDTGDRTDALTTNTDPTAHLIKEVGGEALVRRLTPT